MFKCNLTKATYDYKNMNLLELRNKMMDQFGLKPWDIYAGYAENSVIQYEEKSVEVSAVNTPWKIKLATNIAKRIDERDARVQKTIDTLTEELNQIGVTILELAKNKTGVDYSTYEDYRNEFGFNIGVPTSLLDKRNAVTRELNGIKGGLRFHNEKVDITPEDLAIFDDALLFVSSHTYGRSGVETAETLLAKFDYRQMICILDYCEKNNLSNEAKLLAFKVDTTKEYAVHIDDFKGKEYPELIKMESSYSSDYEYRLYKKVPHDEIYSFIVSELNKYAERVVDVDRDVYYQQVDITPITINITVEGELELIDGYKRLLYVNDPELLNITAPIKVFNGLSDKDFIRLLYSANAWKTSDRSSYAIPFHDRGYIFALRQRFGVRFEDYFHNTWKDIDLLKLLQLYDAPSKYCLYNQYLVEDMRALSHLDQIKMSLFKNENNAIYRRVINTTIRILGETRRNNLDKEQNGIDFNKFLAEVLSDKAFAKKLASKETLTVGGHIDNFIVKDVAPVLKAALETAVLRRE